MGQTPGTQLEGSKTLPPPPLRDNHCGQKPSLRDRTGSQKPHPRDIKLENFTNIIYVTLTLFEMKSFVDLTTVFQWGDWLLKYISFGGHQSQTIERIKALYDLYRCMLILFWEKVLETYKTYFKFLSILSKFFIVRVFIVIKYLTTANQLLTEQQKFF